MLLLLCCCFTALQHISCNFRRGQLSYPHCSWAGLLGSLQVLSAHCFANNWQLPLNQRRARMAEKIISWPISTKECFRTWGSNPRLSAYHADAHPIELLRPAVLCSVQASHLKLWSFSFETVKQWACRWSSFKFYTIECFTAGQDHVANFKLS